MPNEGTLIIPNEEKHCQTKRQEFLSPRDMSVETDPSEFLTATEFGQS